MSGPAAHNARSRRRVHGQSRSGGVAGRQLVVVLLTLFPASGAAFGWLATGTGPYLSLPIVVCPRDDMPDMPAKADEPAEADLDEPVGRKIAGAEEGAVFRRFGKDHPGNERVSGESVNEVSRGPGHAKADACPQATLPVGVTRYKLIGSNLNFSGDTPYRHEQCLAVPWDWPVVAGILNNALAVIGNVGRHGIHQTWVAVTREQGLDDATLLTGLGVALAVIAGVVVWNRTLARRVRQRTDELEETNQQLRRSEARYRRLADLAFEGILLHDRGVVVDLNEACTRITGYPREELIGRDIAERLVPEPAREDFRRRWQTVEGAPFEIQIQRRDGASVQVEIQTRATEPDGPQVCAIRDVTERSRMEKELRESEGRARAVYDLAHEFIGLCTPDGTLIEASRASLDSVGAELDDVINKPLWDTPWWAHSAEEQQRIRDALHTAATGQSVRMEMTHPDRHGHIHIMDFSLKPVTDGNAEVVLLIPEGRDITDRKQAEQALRDSRQQLHDIIDFLPDATFAIGVDGRIIAWNRAIEEMTGVPASVMLGKGDYEYAVPFFGARHPILIDFVFASRPAQEPNYLHIHRSGDTLTAESRVVTINDRLLHLSIKATAIRNADHEIVGAIESVRDVTDFKELEQERLRLSRILEGTPDLVSMAWPDGRIMYVNAAARHGLGWDGEEAWQAHVVDDIHPPWACELIRHTGIPAAEAHGTWQGESAFIDRDGIEVPVSQLIMAHRLPSGKVEYLSTIMSDISTRKRAEDALRESETRYRSLFEAADDAIFLMDRDVFVDCNPRALEVYRCRREQILQHHPYEFSPKCQPDGQLSDEKASRIIEAGLAGQPQFFEWRHCRLDGTGFDAEVSLTRVLLADTPHLLAIVRDISERKEAEEERRHNESFLQAIIDTSQDWIWAMDVSGLHTYSNPAVRSILGYEPEEIVGRDAFAMLHPDDRAHVEQLLPACIQRETGWRNVGLRWRHRDGRYRYLESSAVPVFDEQGNLCQFRGTDRDVTERKQAEEALEEAQALLMAAVEQSPSGILIADAPGVRIRLANPAAFGIRGETSVALTDIEVAQHQQHWQTFRPDGVTPYPSEELPLSRAVREGFVSRDVEVIIRSEQGEQRWVSANAGPVRDKQGQIRAGIVVFHDITDRKHAEAQIRKLNIDLEHRVEQRTAQLAEANKALTEFAYVVSHDLKAPLRGVNQLAHWIREDHGDALDGEGRHKLGLMMGRIRRMHALIDGILAYSRVGRTETEPGPVNLDEVAREVVEVLHPPDHIHVTVEPSLPVVQADRTRMEQIFQNLIGNAIQYMDKPEGRVTVRCEDHGSCWRIRVADNGPGIDAKYHEKVFGIFQTLTPRDQQEGTGIGLTLVKKIVELYGASVDLSSEPGQGATFTVTWPK